MFKKPPVLKPLTPLRSSSRRSFLAHLQELYPNLASAPPEIVLQVVPNGLKHCNAITSAEQKAVIYTDERGKPLWFELGPEAGAALQQSQQKKNNGKPGQGSKTKIYEVFPTVYVLFILPNLLPRLPTWPQLVEPTLCSGSALMLPGLIPPPNTFPDGQITSVFPPVSSIIAITPYPSPIPWVVARSELAMEEMCRKRAAGEKGKAATVIHSKGDFLWEMGGRRMPPDAEEGAKIEEALKNYLKSGGTEETLQDQMQQLDIATNDQVADEASDNGHLTNTNGCHRQEIFSTAEVDAIMHLAFLHSLLKVSKQGDSVPIQLSSFFSSQVLPNRPAHWPPRDAKGRSRSRLPSRLTQDVQGQEERIVTAENADIKHTSAKKLSKWIKSYEKNDLIKCKESKGKEIILIHIDPKHEELKDLTPYFTISQRQKDINERGEELSAEAISFSNKSDTAIIVVERFWRASASSVRLFQEMGASTSEPLSLPVIRDRLLDYMSAHSLIDPRNQAQIRLNEPILVHALYPRAQLHEIPASLSRSEMVDRLLATSCVEYHRTSRLFPSKAAAVIQLNTKGKAAAKEATDAIAEDEFIGAIVKGAARPINIEIKTRQGRKVVSLITGLEVYGIDSEVFAHDLMKLGASASATALPGSTAKAPKFEVFVQGDQRKAILDFLEKRGINRQIVQVHDGTK